MFLGTKFTQRVLQIQISSTAKDKLKVTHQQQDFEMNSASDLSSD
jgi:hypothetical protein